MPEGAHPLPGWEGLPEVPLDGMSWPVPFAAMILDIPESRLRKMIKNAGLQPSGVMNMRPYRSQGRAARAYPAGELIRLAEASFPGKADST